MSRVLRELARHWLQAGARAVVVQVVQVAGSVPRGVGTRMLVDAQGHTAGTIGGGRLEWEVIDAAQKMAGQSAWSAHEVRELDFPLGPRLGQCCGGRVHVQLRPLNESTWDAWPEASWRFTLHLWGAGHVGQAIVHALQGIEARVRWLDEREEFLEQPKAAPAHAHPSPSVGALQLERVWSDPLHAEVANAQAGDFHLVLTHRHDLDFRISLALCQRADFGFWGLIGSATKRARFEHQLRDHGVSPDTLARMVCPIGLPGIEGKEPAVIAASVVAQLLKESAPPESR